MRKITLITILVIFSSMLSFGQTYEIDTYDTQTITTCSGTIYDSGGSSGDYTNYEDYSMTVTSATSGDQVQLVISYDTESSYDYLYIYNGTSTSASLLYSLNGSGSVTVTGNNASESLHLVFHSDVSNTYSGFSASISCVTVAPSTPNTQDCLGAIPVCNGAYSNSNSYSGTGNIPDEIDGGLSCLASGEKNDVWYVFTAQNTDNIGFTITPNSLSDDYDWAVFDLTNATCADVYNDLSIELSCNWSATDGATGASTSGNGNSQGATGTVWNDLIPVVAGGTYVINVSNYSSTQYGYDIDFTASGSASTMVDQSAPLLDQITSSPACGESQITFNFTERVLCSSVSSSDFTVTGPGGTYSITNVNCNSGSTYSQSFTITLNTPLTAGGTYDLNLTGQVDDACGNTVNGNTLSFTVTGVVGTATVTSNVNCYGQSNGAATISGSGGTAPYTYNWNTGSTSNSISSLAAGTYTVTVTDNGGVCQDVETVTITQPSAITSSFTHNNANCNGDANGSATVTALNGTPGYSYSWTGGQTAQTATNLSAGTYTVTITDANSCTHTNSVTITEPLALTLDSAQLIEPLCYGGSNGQIVLHNIHDGTPGYTVNWSNGGTGTSITNLPAGNYYGTITDSHGCTLTNSPTPFVLGQPTAISNTNTVTDVDCNGGSDGSISTSASGGTGTLTYFWNPTGQTSSTATGLSAGNYNITITDANSCTLTQSNITVNQPNTLSIDATTFTAPSCNAGSNGTATVTSVSGGTPNYTYHWSNGQNTQTATSLSASTYSVTVTDNNGCTKVTTVTVTQPTNVSSSVSFAQPNCNGESNGSATVTGSGGTPSYTYLWDSNAGNATTATASGLSAGTYNVTVYDSHSCPHTNSVTITEPTALAFDGMTIVDVNCNGGSDGQLSPVNPHGGTLPYTYLWQDGQTTVSATGLSAGSFSGTMTDANGCELSASFTVGQPTAIANTNTVTDATCNGSSTGSISTSVSGGTTPYSYLWDASTGGQTSTMASNLSAGSYSLTVTDAHNCTFVNSNISVNEDPAIVINISSNTPASCGNPDGTATVTASGGSGSGYSYAWEGGQTGSTISGVAAGAYDVTVTDGHTCQEVLEVNINDAGAPSISEVGAGHTDILCNGNNTGTAQVIGSGGTGSLTYSWSNGAGNVTSISSLTAGSYTASVTDGNGCVSTIPITISEPTALNAIISTSTNPTCFGYSDGTVSVSASGGTSSGTYGYLWNSSPSQTTQTATNLPIGTYTVTVTDDNGCTTSKVVTLTQPSAVSIDATSFVEPLCHNGTNGSATVNTVTGGTSGSGSYSYSWDTSPTQNGQTASNLADGTYNVTVSDDNACTATTSVTVTEPTQVTSTVSFVEPLCNGNSNGTATVVGNNGTAGYTYLWDANAGSQTTATATNLSAGVTYSVTVFDNNNCQTTNSVLLTQPSVLAIDGILSTEPNCFGESNGQLSVDNPHGGTPNYNYTWSPSGGTSQTETGLGVGTYSVTIQDDNGCQLVQTDIVLSQPTAIINSNTITNTTCNGNSTGSIVTNASGGTGALSYAWGPNGETTSNISNIPAGSYSVTITDTHSCELVVSNINVTEPTALNIDATSFVQPLCFTDNNGTATVNVSGGTVSGTYSYLWNTSPAQIGQTAVNLSAGSYSVTITDDNSCTISTSVTVTQPTLLSVGISSSNPVCNGDNNGSAIANGSGGTISSDYSYVWDDGLGQTTQTASNLIIGTYNVTITDDNGCTATDVVTLTEPTELLSSITYDNVKCFGNSDGYAIVTASDGSPAYNYQWDAAAGSATTDSVGGLTIGTYYVTITDSHLCTKIDSATIIQPPLLTISGSSVDVLCNGGNDGQGNITVNGGTNPYTFNWSNGTTNQNITEQIGTYTVTITDNNFCTETTSVTITEPSAVNATSVISNPNCGNNDGSIAVTATGGVGSYTYLWDSGAGSSTNDTVNALYSGSYSVSVYDGNNCEFVLVSALSDLGSANIAITDSMNVKCYGDSTAYAQVDILSGGTAPFHYTWYEDGVLISYPDTNLIENIGAGNYSVNVLDDNNCSSSVSFSILQNPPITGPLHIDSFISCYGFSDGVISAVPTGGSGHYTYDWDHDATLHDSTATGLSSGFYEVTIIDDSLCTRIKSITINDPDPIVLSLTDSTNVSCFGGNNGSINVLPTGGTALSGYIYNWNNGDNTNIADSLAAGYHQITVTDDNGCYTVDSFQVGEPSELFTPATVTNSICGGSTGSVTMNPIGGTSPYSYYWEYAGLNDTLNNLGGLSSGNQLVIVTDANGCVKDTTLFIVDNGAGTFNLVSTTDANCFGESSGVIIAGINGGTPDYTYVIHTGTLLVDSFETSYSVDTINNLSNGTYTILIYDNYGCVTQEGTAIINQPDQLLTSDSIINVSCYNGNNGAVYLSTIGGTPNYNYNWSTGDTLETINNLVAGTYMVTILDNHLCEETHSYNIIEPSSPNTITVNNISNVDCYGNSTGTTSIQMNGGTAPYTYNWSSGSTDSTALDLAAGTYTVTVVDINNCVASDTVVITEPDSIEITVSSVSNNLCYNDSTGVIDISVDGGTPQYEYLWSNGDNNSSLNNVPAGSYVLTVTDANLCTKTISQILINPNQIALSDSIYTEDYYGVIEVTPIGGLPDYNYIWSNGEIGNLVSGLYAGDYTVTVTDANGCTVENYYKIDIELIIPSVITPNDDGKNDKFRIININAFEEADIKVFNRWGDIIFDYAGTGIGYEDESKQWDGTYNGNELPVGSYVYIIDLKNEDDPYTGTVTIVR